MSRSDAYPAESLAYIAHQKLNQLKFLKPDMKEALMSFSCQAYADL